MGLSIVASVLCDNCNVTTASQASVDAPLPDGWCRAQGYVNMSNGESAAVDGFFCPGCVTAQGTKALVKKAADISSNLT